MQAPQLELTCSSALSILKLLEMGVEKGFSKAARIMEAQKRGND